VPGHLDLKVRRAQARERSIGDEARHGEHDQAEERDTHARHHGDFGRALAPRQHGKIRRGRHVGSPAREREADGDQDGDEHHRAHGERQPPQRFDVRGLRAG